MAKKNDSEPATKADIQSLDHKIEGIAQHLDQKIDGVAQRLDQKIDGVAQRLDQKIDAAVLRLGAELVKTQADVRDIKDTMATKLATKEDVNRIVTTIDSFLGDLKTYSRETVWLPKAVNDHAEKIRDHENRLGRLESGVR